MSAVMPIMSIYRLPLGQYGYTGHIINLPQDVVTFAHSLPRLPSEVDVLIVQKDYQQSHKDFRVRRSVVQDALTYLIENNKYYRANAICLNQEALQQLLNYYYFITYSITFMYPKALFKLYASLAPTLATLAQMTSTSPWLYITRGLWNLCSSEHSLYGRVSR